MGKLMFNSILRASMMTYLATVLALWISFKEINLGDSKGRIDLAVAIFILIYASVLPFFVLWHLRRKSENMPEADFKIKYDSLYANQDYHNKRALPMTTYFLLRRLAFAAIIAYLGFSIVLQVLLADILSTGLLIFYIVVRPMYDKVNNAIQIINEAVVLVCVWLMFLFTEYVGDPV